MEFTSFILSARGRGNRAPVSIPIDNPALLAETIEHWRNTAGKSRGIAKKDIVVQGVVDLDLDSAIAGSPEVAS